MKNISLKEMAKAFEAADSVMEILINLSDKELKEKARRVKFLYSTEAYDQGEKDEDEPSLYFFAYIDDECRSVGYGYTFKKLSKSSDTDINKIAKKIYKSLNLKKFFN